LTGVVLYRRTQIAWPTIVPLVAVAAILVPVFISMQLVAGPWIVAVVYGVVLLLFATLTVTVTGDRLEAAFGIGVVRKSVLFAGVVSFARVRNRWFNGWGIHFYPGGTLYNASGLSAVEFKLSSGRFVSIGTAEPDALVSAVQQATGKTEASHEPRSARVWGAQHTFGMIAGALALALAGSSFYFGLQPPTTIAGFDSLYVSNGVYRDTIAYKSMRSITLEPALPRIGLKTNGFGAGNTLRGNFRLDDWGVSRLYINRDAPPFVVILTAENRHVVVNFREPERTRGLYTDLRSHLAHAGR
jgi:hypothetical protein